ncbi:MAG TPA: RidA family protein, partial [Xanthobacteraceae bacterium]
MTKSATCTVEPLLPVELGAGRIRFAQGIKAGRWVFASGLMAQDFVNGIAPDVLAERAPHAGAPKREKEALRIFENLDAVLRAAGTGRQNLVRTDQYYATVKAVPPYQQVRRQFLQGRIPPSTSIAQQGFLLPGADMNIQAMAIVPEKNFEVEHLRHEQLQGRPTSGYSAAVTAGDFIFIPGITSLAVGDEPRRNGVAAAALMAEGAQWGGQPIKLETEFIITRRMTASLALAGAKLEDVVHAQVYLAEREDYSAFNEAWVRHFGENGPTVSIIPCIERGLAPYDGKIEINVIAARPGSAAARRHVDAGVATAFRHQAQAVRAGDLVFIPALMAADHDGLVPSAAVDPRQPYFASSAERQAEVIIDNIARLAEAAGTSLA